MGKPSKVSTWNGFQRSWCNYISHELSSNSPQGNSVTLPCSFRAYETVCWMLPSTTWIPRCTFDLQHYTGFVIVDELQRSWLPGWYIVHGYHGGSDGVVAGLVLWVATCIWMTHFSSFMADHLLADFVCRISWSLTWFSYSGPSYCIL